jgi:hypothetical protein
MNFERRVKNLEEQFFTDDDVKAARAQARLAEFERLRAFRRHLSQEEIKEVLEEAQRRPTALEGEDRMERVEEDFFSWRTPWT